MCCIVRIIFYYALLEVVILFLFYNNGMIDVFDLFEYFNIIRICRIFFFFFFNKIYITLSNPLCYEYNLFYELQFNVYYYIPATMHRLALL